MRDRELDRIDAREIGGVEHMLPPGARLGLLAEHRRQGIVDRIERRHRGQPERATTLFEDAPRRAVDESIDDEAGILGDFLTDARSEEHTYELQSLMRISYAVFCL